MIKFQTNPAPGCGAAAEGDNHKVVETEGFQTKTQSFKILRDLPGGSQPWLHIGISCGAFFFFFFFFNPQGQMLVLLTSQIALGTEITVSLFIKG